MISEKFDSVVFIENTSIAHSMVFIGSEPIRSQHLHRLTDTFGMANSLRETALGRQEDWEKPDGRSVVKNLPRPDLNPYPYEYPPL